jgi:hypothetical protein
VGLSHLPRPEQRNGREAGELEFEPINQATPHHHCMLGARFCNCNDWPGIKAGMAATARQGLAKATDLLDDAAVGLDLGPALGLARPAACVDTLDSADLGFQPVPRLRLFDRKGAVSC